MAENIVEFKQDGRFTIPIFEKDLMVLAKDSFNKEDIFYKEIYNIYNTKSQKKLKIKPGGPEDLTPQKCAEMFEMIEEIIGFGAKEIFEILRDQSFYREIRKKVTQDVNKDIKQIFKTENFENAELSEEIKKQIDDYIKEGGKLNKSTTRVLANNIIPALDKAVNPNGESKEISGAFEKIRIQRTISIFFDNKGEYTNISLRVTGQEGSLKLGEYREKEKRFIWTIERYQRLIKYLNNAYNLAITPPKFIYDFMYNKDNPIPIEENTIKQLINNFKFALFDRYEKKYGKNKTLQRKISIILNSNTTQQAIKDIINTTSSTSENFKDLFRGEKTDKKISGDLGEAIVGLLFKILMEASVEETEFLGDTQTGFGQAAVDLYIKGMGFQVKNYPSKESAEVITLYETSNSLTEKGENGKIKISETDKYLTQKEKKSIYESFEERNIENIESNLKDILQKELPKFVRYSQNFKVTENATQEIIDELKVKNNNFYILNFRIIPASRIFYELSESFEADNKLKIEDLFYLNKTKDTNILDFSKGIKIAQDYYKKDPFSIYFKGIPINYSSLKGKSNNNNLLSTVFE